MRLQIARRVPAMTTRNLSTLIPSPQPHGTICHHMPLSEQEAANTLELLDSSLEKLKSLTAGLSVEQWHHRPTPEAWSPAEVVAHLRTADEVILGRIEAMLTGPESAAEMLEKTVGQEARLLRHVPNRARRVPAPLDMIPQVIAETPAEGLAGLAATRERAKAMLSQSGLKLRVFPHFGLGPLTAYQWLILIGVHSLRHAAQIEEQLS